MVNLSICPSLIKTATEGANSSAAVDLLVSPAVMKRQGINNLSTTLEPV